MKTAELRARARYECSPDLRADLEVLARAYLHLAEQAARNQKSDISSETAPKTEAQNERSGR